MESNLLASEALKLLLSEYKFISVLDIGCGSGLHTNIFRQHGKQVVSIDLKSKYDFSPDLICDYLSYEFEERFDLIWCSHVLEHQLNVNFFLRKLLRDLHDDGLYAITVPPMKSEIVGGHVTVWNAGLLLYNLILAGFDCSQCRIKKYGYNVSIIGRKKVACLPNLEMDLGDIERLGKFFPVPMYQEVCGDFEAINWQ